MREIVTLQLGNLANYVGTHFWNTQEEYFTYGSDSDSNATSVELDHDILYRAGKTPTGSETYTPRVLVYDLKGGFGSLQKYNQLFAVEENDTVDWDQGVNKVVSDPYVKNEFQQQLERMDVDPDAEITRLDDRSVKTWSDFNRIYYHPRSMNPVTTHNMDDSIMPYNTYPVGRQSYSDFERETESFEDNFRHFVEECDNLQGFQVLASVDNAFSGFTEGLLHDVRDEFAKTPILCYGLQSSSMPAQERAKHRVVLNRSLSMTRILDLCTTYVPLYTPSPAHIRKSGMLPYIHPNCNSLYHTSGILSAAIETISLTYRVKRNQMSIGDLCYKMNGQGTTRLSGISASLPLPFLRDGFEATQKLFQNNIAPMLELSKLILDNDTSSNLFAEDVVVRGLPRSSVPASDKGLYEYTRSLYHKFSHTEPRFIDNIPYPLPNSYPQFFTSKCDKKGFLSQELTTDTLESVPVLSRMYTGSELCPEIDNLVKQVESIPFRQMSDYSEGKYGLAYSDYLELKEGLMHLSDAYTEDSELMLE